MSVGTASFPRSPPSFARISASISRPPAGHRGAAARRRLRPHHRRHRGRELLAVPGGEDRAAGGRRRSGAGPRARSWPASPNSPPPLAIEMAREAERVGVDGAMVMPALVYSSKPHETKAHFEGVAKASDLPIMVYNNPPIYRNDVTPEILASLAGMRDHRRLQGFLRRYAPLHRYPQHGGRPLRAVLRSRRCRDGKRDAGRGRLGLRPLQRLSRARARRCSAWRAPGRYREAMPLYEWFMPLLHLDARPDLVQCIKLCEELMGRGSARTRPPRLALAPDERAEVEVLMRARAGDAAAAARCRA